MWYIYIFIKIQKSLAIIYHINNHWYDNFTIYFKSMKCANSPLVDFATIMKDISQEKRLQIICMLSKVESLCVCDITEKLWIKQNLVSHHLKVLKDLWFLTTKQEWKNIKYSINHERFDEFKNNLKHIFNI